MYNMAIDTPNKLFTSSYLKDLQNDNAINESNRIMNASSQLLNFTLQSSRIDTSRASNDEFVKNKNKYTDNDMSLNKILASLVANDSETSRIIPETKVDNDKIKNKEKISNKNKDLVKTAAKFISNYISHSSKKNEIESLRENIKNILPFAETNTDFHNKEDNKSQHKDQDDSNPSFYRNSFDIKEHPSIDYTKGNRNPTKQKYQKYINKRRSASRGVFDYNDSTKENNLEKAYNKKLKNKIRHMRTKTLTGEFYQQNNKQTTHTQAHKIDPKMHKIQRKSYK